MTVPATYMAPGAQAALIRQGRANRAVRRLLRELRVIVKRDDDTEKLLDDRHTKHQTRRFTGACITDWGNL